MSKLPSLDLLARAHAFPCPYTFKVIGKADQSFLAKVIAAVREELNLEIDPPYRVRESVGGRHLAVTVEPVVPSAQRTLDVYCRLERIEDVVMLF